jgi:hypothetical protein
VVIWEGRIPGNDGLKAHSAGEGPKGWSFGRAISPEMLVLGCISRTLKSGVSI